PRPRPSGVRRPPRGGGQHGRAGTAAAGRPGVRQPAAGAHARPAHRQRSRPATTGTGVRERILGAMLDREQDRWAATFPRRVLTSGSRARQQAVAAATLLAPPTESV